MQHSNALCSLLQERACREHTSTPAVFVALLAGAAAAAVPATSAARLLPLRLLSIAKYRLMMFDELDICLQVQTKEISSSSSTGGSSVGSSSCMIA